MLLQRGKQHQPEATEGITERGGEGIVGPLRKRKNTGTAKKQLIDREGESFFLGGKRDRGGLSQKGGRGKKR